MNRMRQIAMVALLLTLAGCLVWCAIPLHEFLQNQAVASAEMPALMDGAKELVANANEATAAVTSMTRQANGTLSVVNETLSGKHGLKQLLYNANLTTAQIARTSTTLEIASKDEHQAVLAANQQLLAAMMKLNSLVSDTDHQVNGPEGTIAALTADLTKTGHAIDELTGPEGMLAQGTAAITSAGKLLGDPHLVEITQHADAMSEHLNGAAAETEETLGYIRDSFKPHKISFWQTILSKGIGAIPEGLIDYFLHRTPQEVTVVGK